MFNECAATTLATGPVFQSYLSPCLTGEKETRGEDSERAFQSYLSPCLTMSEEGRKEEEQESFNPTLVRV